MFLFIFTSLSEIGLFYYKPKDIFCQHKNNYLRRVAAPDHIASVSLPHFKKTKKQRIIPHCFHSTAASCRSQSYCLCSSSLISRKQKTANTLRRVNLTAASCRSQSYCLRYSSLISKNTKTTNHYSSLKSPSGELMSGRVISVSIQLPKILSPFYLR